MLSDATMDIQPSTRLARVAICTHDRIADMRRCLAALMPQADAAGVGVLVVDSGTPEPAATELRLLAESHGAVLHRVDEPGVSLARQEAMTAAESEWVLFLDDDAEPRAGWLDGMLEAIREAPDDVGAIGGRILPVYPKGSSVSHIDEEWLLLLSCVDHPQDGDVADGNNVCCANMAVRSSAVAAIGGFPTQLGRVGLCLLSCEESYVIERMRDEGVRSIYDRRSAVDHHIPAARLDVKWARDRIYWQGISWIRMSRELGRPLPSYLNPVKLGLSLPALWVMGTLRGWPTKLRFRMARAEGQFKERVGLIG